MRQKKNDTLNIWRKSISALLLIFLLIMAGIKYSGKINVEDVFNGQYKYVGQTLNSKADGYGRKYTLKDTLIYEGEFEVNQFDGFGKWYIIIENSAGSEITRLKYEGSFESGLYHGYGKKYYANECDVEYGKVIYHGHIENGKCVSEGIFYDIHGHVISFYLGNFTSETSLKKQYPFPTDIIWNK